MLLYKEGVIRFMCSHLASSMRLVEVWVDYLNACKYEYESTIYISVIF